MDQLHLCTKVFLASADESKLFVLYDTSTNTEGALQYSTRSDHWGWSLGRAVVAAVGIIKQIHAKFNIGGKELADLLLSEVGFLFAVEVEAICIFF